jgi:hypothetical protein
MDCESVLIWKKDNAITIVFENKIQIIKSIFRLLWVLVFNNNSINKKTFIRFQSCNINPMKFVSKVLYNDND